MTTLTCLWCPYTETGEGYEPHDRLAEHYLRCLARAKPCGCHLGGRNRTDVWTCDEHASAFLRERTVARQRRRAREKARRVSSACGGCGTASPTDLCGRCAALLEAFCTQEACI